MAPGMSPAWCSSTARRRSASGEGCCASAAQASQIARPIALVRAIPSPLCQDLTNRSLQLRRPEIEFAEAGVEGDFTVAADQVEATGPGLEGHFGGAFQTIDKRGKGKLQFPEA